MSTPPLWHSIRDRKLADRASHIPKEWLIPSENLPSHDVLDVTDIPRTCGVLTPREVHITESYDARGLRDALINRSFTAVEVTTAFCKVRHPEALLCILAVVRFFPVPTMPIHHFSLVQPMFY